MANETPGAVPDELAWYARVKGEKLWYVERLESRVSRVETAKGTVAMLQKPYVPYTPKAEWSWQTVGPPFATEGEAKDAMASRRAENPQHELRVAEHPRKGYALMHDGRRVGFLYLTEDEYDDLDAYFESEYRPEYTVEEL